MKKLVLTLMFFGVLVLSGFSQATQEGPLETLSLKRGNLPPAVIKAADELFKGATQIKWGVFPYELKDYGWEVNNDYNEPIDHYEIHMHGSEGSEIYAVFESTGELISYRMSKKNTALPPAVLNSIANSDYKDWRLIEDTELIKNNQKKVADHYSVKLEKGNDKKTLYFSLNGDRLVNK